MKNNVFEKLEITDVSRETSEFVLSLFEHHRKAYSRLIEIWLRWNSRVNLFSKSTKEEDLINHIIHSLYLVVSTDFFDDKKMNIIDAGTGGGLPGLPMAIACPDRNFILVDKVLKKTLAVRDIIRSLALNNVVAIHQNIAELDINRSSRVVSKHAFPVQVLLKALNGKPVHEISMLKGDDIFSEINEGMVINYKITLKRFNIHGNPFFHKRYIVHIHRR